MAMQFRTSGTPAFILVPGLNDSGPSHWQSLWQTMLRNADRAPLGDWDAPNRDGWVARLDEAIRTARGPVILCAHSLGCHAVAWWAALRAKADGWPVAGALLVAPPDCDREGAHSVLQDFGSAPIVKLPFPTILTASRDDHYATLDQSRRMARDWGAEFVDSGRLGHINADSDVGHWPDGLSLLSRVLSRAGFGQRDKVPERHRKETARSFA